MAYIVYINTIIYYIVGNFLHTAAQELLRPLLLDGQQERVRAEQQEWRAEERLQSQVRQELDQQQVVQEEE